MVCGVAVARAVFEALGGGSRIEPRAADGERAGRGRRARCALAGSAHAILAGERTALNFLGRLCGGRDRTRAASCDAVAGTGVAIVDTRKTLPGWRALDKYAVAVGGGAQPPHRPLRRDPRQGQPHRRRGRRRARGEGRARGGAGARLRVQVEVESEAQAEEALEAGADSLLLDNRGVAELRALARALPRPHDCSRRRAACTLDNVRAIAETGVHRISIGALTHSAPHADVALEVAWPGARA